MKSRHPEGERKGVPAALATATDFMMVRAALVRHLGGGNQTLVFTRIQWRCETPGAGRVPDETGLWWQATLACLSEETGLSLSAVRTALKNLESAGAIESKKHHLGGNISDQTLSYRPIWEPVQPDGAQINLPDSAHSGMPGAADLEMSEVASLSYRDLRNTDEDVPPVVPQSGDEPTQSALMVIEGGGEGARSGKSRRKPSLPIPEGWKPDSSVVDDLRLKYPRVDLDEALEGFSEYAETHDRRVANWNSAFRSWVRKANEFALRDGRVSKPMHPNGISLTPAELKRAQQVESRKSRPDVALLEAAGIPLTHEQRVNLGLAGPAASGAQIIDADGFTCDFVPLAPKSTMFDLLPLEAA